MLSFRLFIHLLVLSDFFLLLLVFFFPLFISYSCVLSFVVCFVFVLSFLLSFRVYLFVCLVFFFFVFFFFASRTLYFSSFYLFFFFDLCSLSVRVFFSSSGVLSNREFRKQYLNT